LFWKAKPSPQAEHNGSGSMPCWAPGLAWRRKKPYLFSGTILANLQAGSCNATLDEVAHACRMAGVHEDTAEAFAKPINQLKG
jgi:ABC-type transport system involved in cytochrome bd biosynthesis fused ATPase/permease subunit